MKNPCVMDIATKDVKTIPLRSTVMNALKTMVKYRFRRMPVADAGTKKIMGILSATDILNYFGGGSKYQIVEKRFDGNLARAVNENIEEIMTKDVITVKDTDSWKDAVATMFEKKIGGCPIVDKENRVVGIVTERDVVKYLASQKRIDGYVRDYMCKEVLTVTPDITVGEAMKIIINKKLRRLPVVENKKIIGLIVSTDFLRYFSGEAFRFIETGTVEEVLKKSLKEVVEGSDVLKYKKPLIVSPQEKISDLVTKLLENRAGCALVAENHTLLGIITERDLMKFLYEKI